MVFGRAHRLIDRYDLCQFNHNELIILSTICMIKIGRFRAMYRVTNFILSLDTSGIAAYRFHLVNKRAHQVEQSAIRATGEQSIANPDAPLRRPHGISTRTLLVVLVRSGLIETELNMPLGGGRGAGVSLRP